LYVTVVLAYIFGVDKGKKSFNLDEIAALAELPRRTVRYYIQVGLLDRPVGYGKGAHYTSRHVERLILIRKWQLAGLSLERIAEVLKRGDNGALPPAPRRTGTVEVWSHLVVADGVELILEPGRAALSPEQVRAFFRGVAAEFERIRNGDGER
jgi:DNA-binding transcriptional MerR regulator